MVSLSRGGDSRGQSLSPTRQPKLSSLSLLDRIIHFYARCLRDVEIIPKEPREAMQTDSITIAGLGWLQPINNCYERAYICP